MSTIPLAEFADRLSEIMPTVMQEFARRQTNELFKGKITLPQFLVLNFLSQQQESKMTVMANFVGVTTAAMTGIIERLVKYGYCLRVFVPDDRRIIKVRLSSRGADLVRKVNQQRRQMIIKIFGRISEAERREYLKILLRIKEILTNTK